MIGFTRSVQIFQGERLLIAPEWQERLAAIGIAEKQDWAKLEGDVLVSAAPSTKCYRITFDDGEAVYFKRYVYRAKKYWEYWMRPGKAAVETWAFSRLQQLGIPTLDVVAFGEKRILGMLVATFVITREVPDSQELLKFATDEWYYLPALERRRLYREISQQLVEQARKAHHGRLFHHDLKWRNILLCKQGNHCTPVWIDAPRASRMRFRERRGVVVDFSGLARIAISLLSKYDRMRFVWDYLGEARSPGDAKRLYQDVACHLSRRPPRPLKLPSRSA